MKKSARYFTKDDIKRFLEIIRDRIATEPALAKIAEASQHKTGDIPRWNLPPLWTCGGNCRFCKDRCYALKDYDNFRVKAVSKSHARNYNAVVQDIAKVEAYLIKRITKTAPAFFRIHASGDFAVPGLKDPQAYAWMWYRVAKACPGTRFLAFTKTWDEVRGVPFYDLPNFSLVLSEWTDVLEAPADLKEHYRTSRAVEALSDARPNEVICPGNCETCGMCWALSKLGHDVAFEIH